VSITWQVVETLIPGTEPRRQARRGKNVCHSLLEPRRVANGTKCSADPANTVAREKFRHDCALFCTVGLVTVKISNACRRPHEPSRGIRVRTSKMNSRRLGRRVAAVAGGAAIIAMGGLTAACGGGGGGGPSSTTTTTTTTTAPSSTAPPVSPTEKSINPTGGNLFTPPVYAPPAPTEPPGVHRNN
jgi:hypothetical protein